MNECGVNIPILIINVSRLFGMKELILRPLFNQVKELEASFSSISFSNLQRAKHGSRIVDTPSKKASKIPEGTWEIPKGTWEINEEESGVFLPVSLRSLYTWHTCISLFLL